MKTETDLGEGLYASFDGYRINLRAHETAGIIGLR